MMEAIKSLLHHRYSPYIVGGVGVAVLIGIPVVKGILSGRQRNVDVSKYPRDKVILFQFPRGAYAPSFSPFALKLETYLRMAKIPYQTVFGFTPSTKQKIPFIIYNGEEVADSHFCIQHLNRVCGVDVNWQLTKQQRAVARAFHMMTEDHLFWVFELCFWYWYGMSKTEGRAMWELVVPGVPFVLLRWHRNRKVKDQVHAQGIARHTKEEAMSLGEGDIRAISKFLGKKAFLMGDQPCEEDCAVFGLLAQVYWHVPGSLEKLLKGECSNLGDYCERMRERFWPDWVECITHGGTKQAIK